MSLMSAYFPALDAAQSWRLYAVAATRALFLSVLVFLLNRLVDLGTSPTLIASAVALSTLLTTIISFGRLTTRGFFLLCLVLALGYRTLWWLLDLLPAGTIGGIFTFASLELHLNLTMLGALIAAVSTWLFWRSTHALTAELLILAGSCVYLLSGHRNLQLDQPAFVNSLAWTLGWSPLMTLSLTGFGIVLVIVVYLLLTSPPGRPMADGFSLHAPARPQFVYRASRWSLPGLLVGILLLGLLYVITQLTLVGATRVASGSKTAMGVGQENKEELSPLGFHSSLGKTSEPAAFVRLEGDYAENPFTPMLYLREAALSKFNGHEMVIAEARYDQDVNRTRPDAVYGADPDLELLSRTPLVQSVFLLAEHKTAFAVDYPLHIKQLKNPNPGRFKASYRVYSVAPGFSLKDLAGGSVGDPRWDETTRAHYLEAHQDPRYTSLAQKIVEGVSDPVARAFVITQWFSENAIYTLTPGHEVAPGADPVEPFLFGDMRGYCVHFAHAMVYLFRSLGIPARIGTGYLTDLSQARDGHVLLRMNDRHAWSEVYLQGRGWLPFDPQPQQVENHGESPVDMKLLEELMGMIGPGEEILPTDAAKDEAGLAEESPLPRIEPKLITVPLSIILLTILAAKLFLLLGWRVFRQPARRLMLKHRAQEAALFDLGIRRELGETREEFRSRLSGEFSSDVLALTSYVNAIRYGDQTPHQHEIVADTSGFYAALRAKFSWWRRLLGALNPASGIALIMGRWR